MSMLEFENGIACLDGQPVFIVTAEYPYFRDDRTNWESRLSRLRDLGIAVVSTYIPWRHHEIVKDGCRTYDFDGATMPSRDVVGFLGLCHSLNLKVIVKPGPFCHAELNYGGLPDFVCPLFHPDVEPVRSGDGSPVTWTGSEFERDGIPCQWPLPSSFSDTFRAEVRRWFEAVRYHVLADAFAPDGPVVGLQVGNEGMYCDAQHAVWAHDFSDSALRDFRSWLQNRYGTLKGYSEKHGVDVSDWTQIDPPRMWHAPERLRDLAAYLDWSEFLGYHLGRLYAEYSIELGSSVPVLANVNPPVGETWGIDAWLSRVRPEDWGPVNYGYTNWIGIAAENPSALSRYMVLTRRSRGPNMEENWGFTEPYGPAYAYASVCFQQTLLAIAGGATGYNIYTAAGTSSWRDELDRFQTRPYPSHAPIDAAGELTPKAGTLSLMSEFSTRYGADLAECHSAAAAAWGLYLPHSYAGAWISHSWSGTVEGHALPTPGPHLLACQQELLRCGADLDLVNIQSADEADLLRYPILLVSGGPWMDALTQSKLARYAACRKLVVIGEMPELDDSLNPCTVLASAPAITAKDLETGLALLPSLLKQTGATHVTIKPEGRGLAWIRVHPYKNTHFVHVLSRDTDDLQLCYKLRGQRYVLDLTLAPDTGALVCVADGKLNGALIKGVNDRLNRAVTPCCRLRGVEVGGESACDLFAASTTGSWYIRIANQQGHYDKEGERVNLQ